MKKILCPNQDCSSHENLDKRFVVKDGFFYRKDDYRKIQRYKCQKCLSRFSSSTNTLEFRQHKRKNNHYIYLNFVSGVSMRKSARNLDHSRNLIARRLTYFANRARSSQKNFLNKLSGQVKHMQFDDLITKEETKLKPLTVSVAVDAEKRWVLGAEVGSIGARGHLVEISLQKYGPRKNEHSKTLEDLFKKISQTFDDKILIRSDEDVFYKKVVQQFAPHANYEQYSSIKACLTGQGELKKGAFDPLFKINHTFAMFRDSISRLVRRTWSISKKKEKLQDHIDIYVDYYNQTYLIKHKKILL